MNLDDMDLKNLIFETHAHYDDEAFDSDRSQILNDLLNHGIFRIVNASADLISSGKSVSAMYIKVSNINLGKAMALP